MKRLFFLATAAIVALASCSKTQVVYTDAPDQIAFKQITDVMTKAPLEGTLGVFANQGAVVHFGNTEFTLDAGFWTNSTAYWPHEGNLEFTVYAPYKDGTEYADNVLTLKEITAADKLYYGVERYNTGKVASVPVVLKHVSAKITVNVTMNDPYTLTSITLDNATTVGNVTVTYNDPVVVATTVSTTKENLDVTSTKYVLPGNQTQFTIKFKQGNLDFTEVISLADATWVANSEYIYNINVSSPDKIKFVATVVDSWDNGGNVNKTEADFE